MKMWNTLWLISIVFSLSDCQRFVNLKERSRNAAATDARRRQPELNDRVAHKDHDIPEEQIINLPVGRFPEPYCDYSVHWNDERGAKVDSTVQVGDPLFHKWHCYYPGFQLNLYCMMVHNCTISNHFRTVSIINQFGCTRFPSILPDVSYMDDLQGGIQTNAFSLDIDRPSVLFNCGIRLLIKEHGVCPRPTCPKAGGILGRQRRHTSFNDMLR